MVARSITGGARAFAGRMLWLALISMFAGLPSNLLAADQSELTPINLQLRWLHQFQFAGYYAAKELGYYRDMGLDVNILAGAPGREPVKEVLEGRATYGVANSELLYQRLQGKPLVALAAIFQHSAAVLLSKQSSGIRSPQDLIGKRVMALSMESNLTLHAVLRNEGVDHSRVITLKSSYDINDLIEDRVDAFTSYLTNEPFYLAEKGIPISVLYPSTYGVDFYSDILFTSEGELRTNPARVRAFRAASLQGWQFAMDNPEQVIDWILRDYPSDKSREHLQFEAAAMRSLIKPDLVQYGHMNPSRWQHMADTYIVLGMASPNNSLEGFVYDPSQAVEVGRFHWYGWFGWLVGGIILFILATLSLSIYSRRLQSAVRYGNQVREQLREQSAFFQSIFHSTPNATLIADPERRVLLCNPAFSQIFGYRADEVIGESALFLYADLGQFDTQGRLRFHPDASLILTPYEVRYRRKNGRAFPGQSLGGPIKDRHGSLLGYILVVRDITEQKQNEAMIARMALTDALTGLANRHQFNQRLDEGIKLARRQGSRVGLALMDLDLFKAVNDRYGHPIGDAVLRDVARILRLAFRETDLVARIGGDEFAVIMFDPADDAAIGQPCERVVEALSQPLLIEGLSLQLGASFGIATYPLDGRGAADLYRLADQALYTSKQQGRCRCTYGGEIETRLRDDTKPLNQP